MDPRNTSLGASRLRLTDQQRLDWLRLIRSENVGPRTFRSLLNHYGGARAALEALPDLARRGGGGQVGRIVSQDEAEREIAAADRVGVRFVALGEPEYPGLLAAIPDPPPLLGVRGNFGVLSRPAVAIVGSRNASGVGLKFAALMARGMGDAGLVVSSGLARGIDAAAHRASIATGTIAVIAGGHDRIYPPEHEELLEQILENGAAVSEMPMGWEPRGRDFPRRNRLISGLALGVLIVEAARRSGSLITARMALEQGREVFAVPGSPLDPRAEGTNALLKQGAALVTEVEDVLTALGPLVDRTPDARAREPEESADYALGEPNGDDRQRIVALLGPAPLRLDDLVRLSGSTPQVVRMVLLELELAGRLDRQGDGNLALTG